MLAGLLLRLYPASFRAEYGDEIARIFGERRRRAANPLEAVALWGGFIADTVTAAVPAHLDILRQDLTYTGRALRRSPGFTATALAVVALGIGTTTAAFSIADYLLLRPLPFPEPGRLVKLWEDDARQGYNFLDPAPGNYHDWKTMSHSFTGVEAYSTLSANLAGDTSPERLDGAAMTSGVLGLLGAAPALGRTFSAADDSPRAPGVVILSDGLWRRRYGADPGVLGRTVRLDDEPYTVIGIMPPGFAFPARTIEFWKTERFTEDDFTQRDNYYLRVLARLAPGVTLESAREEMRAIGSRLERAWPKENRGIGVRISTLRDDVAQRPRRLVMVLAAAALCVLLIGCANLAGLLLARATARRREFAVRTAIGAGRERLVRQLLTESVVLALGGGVLGIALAAAALPLLAKLAPPVLPVAQDPSLDPRVLGFAVALSLVTGIGFGVAPALRACSATRLDGLREGMRAGGGRRERLRGALVIAEVTVSIVLLVSSGLLLRALMRLRDENPGFRAEGILTLRTALPMPRYAVTSTRFQFYRQVLDGARAIPGVTGAAYTSFLPMLPMGGIFPVELPGRDRASGLHSAMLRVVSPGYFDAMGIALRMGRDVSDSDTLKAPFTAVVSEKFARQYWPGENPLGRHFGFAFFDRVVVGVVADIRARGLERASEPQVYLPYQQIPDGYMTFHAPKDLVVRSTLPAAALLPELRRIVAAADPAQPISDVLPLSALVEAETAPRAIEVRVMGGFAAAALLLAAVGLHGLLSFTVTLRRQEIGVRMALGAVPGDILWMVLGSGARLALAGAVCGSALAYAAGRAIESLLAGVSPADAGVWTAATVLCAGMTLVGSALPAIRAARVDPAGAAKSD